MNFFKMPNLWWCSVLGLSLFRILLALSNIDNSDVIEVSNQHQTHIDNIVKNDFNSGKNKQNGYFQSRTIDSLSYIDKQNVNENGSKSKKRHTPSTNQKSLVFVFDVSASMLDDLEQFKRGAQLIVNKFSQRKDNPIYNYIFVPFRDAGQFLGRFDRISTVSGI